MNGEENSERQGLYRNVALSYANTFVAMLLPLVMIPLCVRLLGHDLYGQWLVILSVTSYQGLANVGLPQAVVNRIVALEARACHESDIESTLSTAFIAYVAISAMLIAVGLIAVTRVAPHLVSHLSQGALPAFVVVFVLSALSFPLDVYAMLLRGFRRVDLEQTIGVGVAISRAAAIAIVLLLGLKLLSLAMVEGIAALSSGVLAFHYASRLSSEVRPRMSRFCAQTFRELAVPSTGFLVIQIGSTLTRGLDNLIVGYALGPAAVTRYAISYRLASTGAGFFGVALAAVMPNVTAAYAKKRGDLLELGMLMSVRLGLFYGAALAILLRLAGPRFVLLWAGPGVFPGDATFNLQIVYMLICILVSPGYTAIMATNHHYRFGAIAILEGLLNLALSLWWVRHWGMAGVIAGTVAANLLTNGWYLPLAGLKALGMPLDRFIRAISPAAVTALSGVAAVEFLRPRTMASSAQLAGFVVIAELVFVLAFLWFGFSRDDRRWFKGQLMLATSSRGRGQAARKGDVLTPQENSSRWSL